MDILGHGLWSAAAGRYSNRRVHPPLSIGWAAFWGVFPDLFSFTVPAAVRIWWWLSGATSSLLPQPGGPQFPFVWHLYNASHSLVPFTAVFGIVWALQRRPPLALLGWALHIVIDIFTHQGMFAVQFLWPLSSIAISGVRWENPWFLTANYLALVVVWSMLRLKRKSRARGKAA
jgi:LexA-binding, inner membrane-associated putative hydrolase